MLEVFKFGTVGQVKALREEGVHLHVVPPDQVLQRVAQADLGGDYVVFHEVVGDLEVLEFGRVVRLDRELEVEDRGLLVGILIPAALDQGLPQGPVAPADNEDLDVRGDSVLLAENIEVRNRLLLLLGFVAG